jgi:malonyl-ACP decarboxylase
MSAGLSSTAPARVAVTGMGIVSAAGTGIAAFAAALREGRCAARPFGGQGRLAAIPAATLAGFDLDEALASSGDIPAALVQRARRAARRAPLPVRAAVAAAVQAWHGAGLARGAPEDTCLVVAGHNVNQRYGAEVRAKFAERPEHLSPAYAVHFLDTDHVGTLSEVLELRGEGLTVGGASASGNVGLLHGLRLVRSGDAPACLVVGAMMDLSEMEMAAFESIGALSPGDPGGDPARACRPFDEWRSGFVYGQASACVVLEPAAAARARGAAILGELCAGSLVLDGTRGTDPSVEGEARAMTLALARAGVPAERIDYVNAHATASRLGDEVELAALERVFGAASPWLNSTKAITGHTLSAAGVVEAIATLIQMSEGFIHPNPNLDDPMRTRCRLAGKTHEHAQAAIALSNSFGFGGIHTSIVLARSESGSWQ